MTEGRPAYRLVVIRRLGRIFMPINVSLALPEAKTSRPPVVLVHGAANSAPVWKFWQRGLADRGWPSYAVDLRGHGPKSSEDLSQAGMGDYARDVGSLIEHIGRPPVVMGWSMGGLVAMMAAASGGCAACVTLAPSTPSREVDPAVELRTGEFGPEEYGITSLDPDDQPGMFDLDMEERRVALSSLGRESRLARDERRRGVVIETMPCPFLIVTGEMDRQWPSERYDGLWLESDRLTVEGASHWGLVLNRRAISQVLPSVTEWLEKAVAGGGLGS